MIVFLNREGDVQQQKVLPPGESFVGYSGKNKSPDFFRRYTLTEFGILDEYNLEDTFLYRRSNPHMVNGQGITAITPEGIFSISAE